MVDQHVALPQGVYGFVFRGRPVELSVSSGSDNRNNASSARDAVIVPSSKSELDKHKPAKAVVNAIFPKGTSRRKAAQKLAKAVSFASISSYIFVLICTLLKLYFRT